jgi:hypothetical protein
MYLLKKREKRLIFYENKKYVELLLTFLLNYTPYI